MTGPSSVKKSPYLLNDLCIFNRSNHRQNNYPICWLALVFITGPSTVKNFPLFFEWSLYIKPPPSFKKNYSYLLNSPCINYRAFISQKIPLIYWMTLVYKRSLFSLFFLTTLFYMFSQIWESFLFWLPYKAVQPVEERKKKTNPS